MEISMGTFRKNVMKTISVKQAKQGLRVVSKSTPRTQIAHLTVAMKSDVGNFIQRVGPYVLGLQMNQEMKDAAFVTFGDVGYDITALCRILKVKMPTATKKSKLVGTRTAAILQLDSLTTGLLEYIQIGLFSEPKMMTINKEVVIPSKHTKEMRDVEVVNVEAEQAAELTRQEQMKKILSAVLDVYWRLCYDMFQTPPAPVLAAKMERMQEEFPDVKFDLSEEADEDAELSDASPSETAEAV